MVYPPEPAVPREGSHPLSELADEHHLHVSIIEDVGSLVRQRSPITAGKRFGELRLHLERHMQVEEELFDLCDQLPRPPPVLKRLRQEHTAILAMLQQVNDGLARNLSADEIEGKLATLQHQLNLHDEQERLQLFPVMETAQLDPQRYRNLLTKLAQT